MSNYWWIRDPLMKKIESRNAKKTERETLWSRPVLYLRGKPFWLISLGQRVQFGGFLKFCRTFGVELFWSLQVYRKKTLTKSHDYSRLEKRRLKRQKSRKHKWMKLSIVFRLPNESYTEIKTYSVAIITVAFENIAIPWLKITNFKTNSLANSIF